MGWEAGVPIARRAMGWAAGVPARPAAWGERAERSIAGSRGRDSRDAKLPPVDLDGQPSTASSARVTGLRASIRFDRKASGLDLSDIKNVINQGAKDGD